MLLSLECVVDSYKSQLDYNNYANNLYQWRYFGL